MSDTGQVIKMDASDGHMTGGVLGALVLCLVMAAAPWFSGGQEPVAMLASATALLLGALLAWRQSKVRRLALGPLVISFAVLLGFGLLSLLWSANHFSTISWVARWLLAGLVFRLAYTIAGEPRGRQWALRAYLGSAVVFCIGALAIFLTSDYDRLTGWFYWANPAAAYLMPAIILAVDGLRRASGRMVYVWGALAVMFSTSFWLTDSRAAMLVLAGILALYLILVPLKKISWIRIVFVLALSFGLSIGGAKLSTITAHHSSSAVPGSRFAEAASGESKSLSDRIFYLSSAFNMWFAHPLGGTGAGTYGNVHPQYQQRVISASTDTHNVYVQTLSELGLVGAVALAAVLLWLFAGMLKGLVAMPEMLPAALGVLALLAHFGLDIDASYPTLLMLVAWLSGLVYRQWANKRAKAAWRWPALAALLLVPIVSLYQSDVWATRAKAAQDDSDYAQAATLFGQAHSGIAYDPDIINAEGIDLYTLAGGGGQDAKAAAALALERAREAQKQDPFDGQHHQLEGRVLALQGDNNGAEQAFKVALKLDPFDTPDYALDLASTQVKVGDLDGAVKTAEAMLAQYPSNVVDNRATDSRIRPALANLEALIGNIWLTRGDVKQAGVAAQRSVKLYPESLRGRALVNLVKRVGGQ